MNNSKVTMIVDLQFGSTGKGLIAGYLAERDEHDTVINANMPNAGHTYINDVGRTWIHKVIPNGIVSPKLKNVMIGPQSVFSLEQLAKEVYNSADLLSGKTVWIHEGATLLHADHKAFEQANLSGISSTMQGSAAASIAKMLRNPKEDYQAKNSADLKEFADNIKISNGVMVQVIDNRKWILLLKASDNILAEAAQGYSLGLNAGFWPYCTSRDCVPARFMSDMGIPLSMLGTVVGTARVHPIRVGSTADGYSGDVYDDQDELTWEDVGQKPELTTVTQRQRRIFSFSHQQIEEAIAACEPDEIFLNFVNYDIEKGTAIAKRYKEQVRYIGFGAARCNIEDLGNG